MILTDGSEELLHKSQPGKRSSLPQVILIGIVGKSFELEWIVTISDIVTLPVRPSKQIEKSIEEPVKNEQHFYLLPEVDLLVAHKLSLIMWLTGDPDEDEEGQSGVIIEYLFPGVDLVG
jgi:hypothetical protein